MCIGETNVSDVRKLCFCNMKILEGYCKGGFRGLEEIFTAASGADCGPVGTAGWMVVVWVPTFEKKISFWSCFLCVVCPGRNRQCITSIGVVIRDSLECHLWATGRMEDLMRGSPLVKHPHLGRSTSMFAGSFLVYSAPAWAPDAWSAVMMSCP